MKTGERILNEVSDKGQGRSDSKTTPFFTLFRTHFYRHAECGVRVPVSLNRGPQWGLTPLRLQFLSIRPDMPSTRIHVLQGETFPAGSGRFEDFPRKVICVAAFQCFLRFPGDSQKQNNFLRIVQTFRKVWSVRIIESRFH